MRAACRDPVALVVVAALAGQAAHWDWGVVLALTVVAVAAADWEQVVSSAKEAPSRCGAFRRMGDATKVWALNSQEGRVVVAVAEGAVGAMAVVAVAGEGEVVEVAVAARARLRAAAAADRAAVEATEVGATWAGTEVPEGREGAEEVRWRSSSAAMRPSLEPVYAVGATPRLLRSPTPVRQDSRPVRGTGATPGALAVVLLATVDMAEAAAKVVPVGVVAKVGKEGLVVPALAAQLGSSLVLSAGVLAARLT